MGHKPMLSRSRCNHFVLFYSGLLLVTPSVSAQTVQVKPNQNANGWDVSYSRKLSPGTFELDTTCATLAAAQREAATLKTWSNQMDAGSDWRLAVILIEGADAQTADSNSSQSDGPKLPSFKEALDAVKTAKKIVDDPLKALQDKLDPHKGLNDYVKNIEGAYDRAKKAKEDVLTLTGKTIDTEFGKVNSLIDKYNSDARGYAKSSGFAGLPKMGRVNSKTLKAADDWRAARRQQFRLEKRKKEFDEDCIRLTAERQELLRSYQTSGNIASVDLTARAKRYNQDIQRYSTMLQQYESEAKLHQQTVGRIARIRSDENQDLIGTAWGGRYAFGSGGGGRMSLWFDGEETGRAIWGVAQDSVTPISWETGDDGEILVYYVVDGQRQDPPMVIRRSSNEMKGTKSTANGLDKFTITKGSGLGRTID
jgi:hypothetical protein